MPRLPPPPPSYGHQRVSTLCILLLGGLRLSLVHSICCLLPIPRNVVLSFCAPTGLTASYEQLYQEHPAKQVNVESLLSLSSMDIDIPDGTVYPELPHSNVNENDEMIPDFFKAMAIFFGANG